MIALQGAIKPYIGIDWSSLNTLPGCIDKVIQFREIAPLSNLTGVGEWPYFLEWLLDRHDFSRGIGDGPLELLVCEFFCSDDWGQAIGSMY